MNRKIDNNIIGDDYIAIQEISVVATKRNVAGFSEVSNLEAVTLFGGSGGGSTYGGVIWL